MSSKRAVVLMAILLALLLAYFGPLLAPQLHHLYVVTVGPPEAPPPAAKAPLPAENAISNLAVRQSSDGRWLVSFDAAYTGTPAGAWVRIYQVTGPVAEGAQSGAMQLHGQEARPGTQRFSTEVTNPNVHTMYVTTELRVQLETYPGPNVLAKANVRQIIRWPDPVLVEVQRELAAGKPQAVVDRAVALIDTHQSDNLQKARRLLQTLVELDPQVDTAYVELARIAMKTNWSREGLQEAEALINSALQIRPGSINASILLAYVYANQGRLKEAEAMNAAAAKADPPNLWLWTNWGELLLMQDRKDAAILKFREAVARPPTGNTYDRARQQAYGHLLYLLKARPDVDALEALYKQRAQEYAGVGCFHMDYARFLLLYRGDVETAANLARENTSTECGPSRAREVTGLGHYVTWAASKGAERSESLHRARAFLPVSPELFRQLATSDRSADVARQLVAAGEKIGMVDNQQLDALAHALRDGDTGAARRLLRLGARPDAPIGNDQMPAALIPVLSRDWDGIRLMQRSGIDYAKLRFQGTTAVDYARKAEDNRLLRALDPKAGSL